MVQKIFLDCQAVRNYGSLFYFVFRSIYYSFPRDAEAGYLKIGIEDTFAECTVRSSKCISYLMSIMWVPCATCA